tara:strand:+ start:1801 stop:2211 length:411 start_codon:yes stop_codon:yes gene_type:complete
MTAKMTGRRGEHVVAAFLCSQDWHPIISDAVGYDIIATKNKSMVRVQVKACGTPSRENSKRRRKYYRWTVGIGRHKQIGIPTDHYDILALVALDVDLISFIKASDVNKKTYRIHPENICKHNSVESWKVAVDEFTE